MLLSAADADEPSHSTCAALLREHRGDLLVPAPVVPETAWLLESRLGPTAEARFLRLITTGVLQVIDLAVASVITIAENRGITTLATLNARDFNVVRPRHTDAFTLLP